MRGLRSLALGALAAAGAVYGVRVPCRTSGMLATAVVLVVGGLVTLGFGSHARSPRARGVRLAAPALVAFGGAGLAVATVAWLVLGRGTCRA
ncbi:MAG: hypothetical protein ACXVD4_14850 [Nocardioides sp.]